VIATELAVSLERDRPGVLARAAEAIASGGLNIDGFAEAEGVFHVLASDPQSARQALTSHGLPVTREREVLVAQVEDRPGTAAHLFRSLADAGLNVSYTYIASGCRIVIAVDDPEKALSLLKTRENP
jgi:hypothetical protein